MIHRGNRVTISGNDRLGKADRRYLKATSSTDSPTTTSVFNMAAIREARKGRRAKAPRRSLQHALASHQRDLIRPEDTMTELEMEAFPALTFVRNGNAVFAHR